MADKDTRDRQEDRARPLEKDEQENDNFLEREFKKNRSLEELVRERTDRLARANQQLQHGIEERKRVEAELRESREKIRALLDASTETVVLLDREGTVLAANAIVAERLGRSVDELLGVCIWELFPAALAESRKGAAEEVIRTGKSLRTEDEREGRIYDVNWYPVFNAEGEVAQVAAFAADITDTRRLEAQLRQAQKMEAIGTLAGGIAHNFNNLLMGIQGNATLARLETDPSHPSYKRLEGIEKLVQSGSKLTSQLLGYARGGSYEVKPVDLNRLVKETADTFSMAKKDITVHFDPAENLPAVEADQGQIEQVLLNLYVNASDAMPEGGELHLATGNATHEHMSGGLYTPKPGKYVLLTVRDTGLGMDAKTLNRVFDPFFTTKGLGRGSGLGLASVYGIVKAHGGYIDVHSEKGVGTTFEVLLPASRQGAAKAEEPHQATAGGKETILFVDDDEVVIQVGREILRKLGYAVIVARRGKEALTIYEAGKERIDMVILDMVMPGMGGGETYDRLKAVDPGIKVLLSSGYGIEGPAGAILERGCDGFIQKPFKMENLSREIKTILAKKRDGGSSVNR